MFEEIAFRRSVTAITPERPLSSFAQRSPQSSDTSCAFNDRTIWSFVLRVMGFPETRAVDHNSRMSRRSPSSCSVAFRCESWKCG